MIWLEVEEHGDLEREVVHVLELERRELADDPRVLGGVHAAQRPPDVPCDDDLASCGAKDRAEQLAGRRLPLRARDADEQARAKQPIAELDLGPDGNPAPARLLHKRALAWYARVLHEHVDAVEQGKILLVAQARVDLYDLHAVTLERRRGRNTGAREAVHEGARHPRKFR